MLFTSLDDSAANSSSYSLNTSDVHHSTENGQNKKASIQIPTYDSQRSTGNKQFKFIRNSEAEDSSRRKSITIRKTNTGQKLLSFSTNGFDAAESTKVSIFKADSHKDTSKELKIDHLSQAIFKAGYNIRDAKLEDILHDDISDEFLEGLYVISAYTINNYFGVPGPKSDGPQKLSSFLNQLIPLNSRKKHESLQKSKSIPPPPFIISIHVIEAMDLVATDPDGLSDPFCKIWLNDRKIFYKSTEVKEHTLNPMWNEKFRFNLHDLKKDIIYFEIWDSDPIGFAKNLKQIKNIRSIRGCWYFCSDLTEDLCHCGGRSVDDFIGKTEIEVGNLYAEGIDEWLSLKTSKGSYQQGQLHVAVRIEATKPKNTIDALKRHLLLVKLCLEHGLKGNVSTDLSIFCWDQILSSSARTLLFQHSVQGNISTFEDSACRFIVIIRLARQNFTFDFQFLYNMLEETNENMKILPSSHENYLSNPLGEIYAQALNGLKTICHGVLSSLHSFDIANDKNKRIEFQFVLMCLSLYEDITGSHAGIWSILRTEADTWSENKAQDLKNIKAKDRNESIMKFLDFLKTYQVAADEVVRNVFPEKNYTEEIYETCQRHLWEPLKFHVSEMARESSHEEETRKKEEVLEIFRKLKEVSNYFNSVLQRPRQIQVGQLHEWFGANTIHDWFVWKKHVVSAQIELLVNRDELETKMVEISGRYDKQTTSVKQTSDLIQKEFYPIWDLMSDSNCSECAASFVFGLHSCCMKYAESLIELIPSRKLSNNFHSGGKKKLCAMANNLWALAWFVKGILEDSGIPLQDEFPDTKFSLQMICKILCRDISGEFKRDIVDHIKSVVLAKTKKEQGIFLKEYATFINKLLKREASTDMAFEIYLLFLSNVWKYVITAVSYYKNKPERTTCLARIRKCLKRASNRCDGLLSILKETEQLCYFDEEGKLKNIVFNEEYKTLKNELEQMKLYR
ncbi:BAI1-associated protein 3 like protein [Argiope bruennichi]|uniref:BAI1-associated protein 3 like protein n=1 Tax=Argiope bruennichi TaxID=94029 RepID=A0A8T0E4J3_ARGBR|nr:BAI1-associated protein 3 like protein [Argiope bruennichi]